MTPTSALSTSAEAASKRDRAVSFTPLQYWGCVAVMIVSVVAAVVSFSLVSGSHNGVCPSETQTSRPGNHSCYPDTLTESRLQ